MSTHRNVNSMSAEEVDAFLRSRLHSQGIVEDEFDLSQLSLDEKHTLASSVLESMSETDQVEGLVDTRLSDSGGEGEVGGTGVGGETGAQGTPPSRESVMASASAELESWQAELVDEFVEVSGADRAMAMRMLEAFGYEMDAAMVMYMEQASEMVPGLPGLVPIPPSESSLNVGGSSIPVPPLSNFFGGLGDLNDEGERGAQGDELDEFGTRRPDPIRNQRLVDSREAESAASYDDVMGRAEDEGVDWMFPPPAHLSFVGNFEVAVDMSNTEKKWLLVNIQHHEEFASHMLNRDTWCDDMVEQVVRSSFIFWQRGSTSSEAQRYISLYKLDVSEMPHISIIDPRTKAKVCSMRGYASPQELVAFLVKFLEENDINANKAPKSRLTHNNIDLQQRALDRSAMMKEGGGIEETPPTAGTENSDKATSESDYFDLDSVARTLDDIATDSAGDETEASFESYGSAPAEPDEGVSGAFKVQLKLPSGKSVKRRFLPTNTIKELHAVALESLRSEGTDDGPFKLTTAFPVKSLSETEYFGKPLGECEVAGTQIIIRKLL